MISLVNTPEKFSLSGEKQTFVIHSDNCYSNPGSSANLLLYFNALYDGYFDLSYGTKTFGFHVRETLLRDGLEIPAYTPNFTLNQWVYIVAAYFNKNFDLVNDFVIYSDENQVLFSAREIGSQFSLNLQIAESIDPGDLYEVANTPGTDKTMRDHFAIGVQVCLQNTVNSSISFGTRLMQNIQIYEGGIAYFCPVDFVEPELQSEFFQQSIASVPVRKNEYLLRRYFLQIAEFFGNPPRYQSVFTSEYFFLINGKIPLQQSPQFEGKSFLQWLSEANRFLTFSPSVKKVLPDQFEKLFFIFRQEFTISPDYRIFLRLKLFFDDESFVIIDLAPGVSNLQTGEVLEIDCGYDQLGIPAILTSYPDKVFVSYSVYMIGKSPQGVETYFSEVKSYEVDFDNHEYRRQFIFKNSLGGFDTIMCTGKSNFEKEYSKEVLEFSNPLIPGTVNLSKKERNAKESFLGNHTTGYFEKSLIPWIEEFFSSDVIFEIEQGIFKPCRISSTSIKLDNEEDNMISIDFQVEYLTNFKKKTTGASNKIEFTNDFNDEFL